MVHQAYVMYSDQSFFVFLKFQFSGSGDRFKSNAANEQKNPDTVQVSVQYPGNEFVAAIPNGKPLLNNFIFHVIEDTLKMIR